MKEGAKCIFNFTVYALHCRRPPLSHNFRTASFAVKTRGRLKLACLVFLFFNMYYGNILDCLNILIRFPKIINLGIWEPAFLQARLTRNNSRGGLVHRSEFLSLASQAPWNAGGSNLPSKKSENSAASCCWVRLRQPCRRLAQLKRPGT